MAVLNTNQSYITAAQYQELSNLMPLVTNGDYSIQNRVAFYVRLAQMTGSQAALDMAEIASSSGIVGGTAWFLNQLYSGKVPGYPADGVTYFSNRIADSTFREVIKVDPTNPNRYIIPSDLEIYKHAQSTWQKVGAENGNHPELGALFPGAPIIFSHYISEGDVANALSTMTVYTLPVGIAGVSGAYWETWSQLFLAGNNNNTSISEYQQRFPNATWNLYTIGGKQVYEIVDNGKAVGVVRLDAAGYLNTYIDGIRLNVSDVIDITTDFLSSSLDSGSNIFSTSTTKDKYGTIAGIRQVAGQSAGEKWGGQTFATSASSNLSGYLGNINFIDPSAAYVNTVINGFNFNTNFGSYVPIPSYINVQVLSIGRPVVLDLNNNGVETISLDESRALFDMNGTGFRQRTAWVAPSDALLAYDYNNDGVIKERKEISFVDWTSNPNLTDMEALAIAFDTNKDGKFDSGDANFSFFRVWQDKNADGVSDAGELKTLAQAGISSIDLKVTKVNWSSGASNISGLGSYTKTDGSKGLLGDAGFGHESAGWKASVVNGIQTVTNEKGDVYGVANPTGNFVVNLSANGLTGAIGGAGQDSLSTTGNTAVFMQGNAGNDTLTGGGGDDWLEGGTGADVISGGAGDDTVVIDAQDNLASIIGGDGFDILVFEGNTGITMQLNLANGFESALGGNGDDQISAQSSYTVPLYWLQGGTYPVFSQWSHLPLLSNFIIAGGKGNDILTGGVGDDILDGGVGDDTIYGDWGKDTYLFGRGDGKDIINDRLMRDWAHSAAQRVMTSGIYPRMYNSTHGLGPEKDTSFTSGANSGGSVVNSLGFPTGNHTFGDQSRNSDTIKLGSNILAADIVIEKPYSIPTAPNYDLLIGIRQDELFTTVKALNDFITVKNWSFLQSGYKGSYQVTYSPSQVETIEFTDGTKLLLSNCFQGELGTNKSDTLLGNASDNLLNGLAGADTMSGGLGGDVYVVDNTGDIVNEAANQGTDTIQTFVTMSSPLGANIENLTLVGNSNIDGTGNSLNNTITGNQYNNIIQGGAGNDTMVGGLGNDDYQVWDAGDVVIENAGEGIDTVWASVNNYVLADNVENMVFNALALDGLRLVGNALNNTITGNQYNNIMQGQAGNDTMVGGLGNDDYQVWDAGDVVIENAGEGIDTVWASVNNYVLADNVENMVFNALALDGVRLTGNALNNTITGNQYNNIIQGGAGTDTLNGLAGNDIFNGGAGGDTLDGGLGNDTYLSGRFMGVNIWDETTLDQDRIIDTDTTVGNADTLVVEAYLNNYTRPITYTEYQTTTTLKRTLENGYDNLSLAFRGDPTDSGDSEYFERITIQDYFKNASNKVENIQFADTGPMSLETFIASRYYDFTGSSANDIMIGTAGVGAMIGGAGDDYMRGTNTSQGTDDYSLSTNGYGNDIIQGLGETDALYDIRGNNLIDGGSGIDNLNSGYRLTATSSSKSLLIGGKDDDYVFSGDQADIVLFNKGDGKDEVYTSAGASDTLSIGGAAGSVQYSHLSFSKTGNDLVLKVSATDQMTFKNWYSGTTYRTITNLQVIAEAIQGFNLGGADNLRNNSIENFNFATLVGDFDNEVASNSLSANNWQLTDALMAKHLGAGSNTAAIGGDLAYQYGKNSNLTNMGLIHAQNVIGNANFGQTAQALNNPTVWQAELVKLA